jgi:hypothetical protein
MMPSDFRIDKLAAVGFEGRQCPDFVGAHQSAVLHDISSENGRKSSLDGTAIHGVAPRRPIHRIERDSPIFNKKRKEAGAARKDVGLPSSADARRIVGLRLVFRFASRAEGPVVPRRGRLSPNIGRPCAM